jgi:hypothetical protein
MKEFGDTGFLLLGIIALFHATKAVAWNWII